MLELTPSRLAASAYRTLGLSASATQAQIDQAARRLRIWPDPNSVPPTLWDLPWLGPISRSKNDIEQAISRLNEPSTRIEERLIWYHGADPALWASPDRTATDQTFGKLAKTTDPAAVHDVALAKLQLALLRDRSFKEIDRWNRVLQRLRALSGSDDYLVWLLDLENNGDFEKRAQIDEIAAAVQALPTSLTSLFAAKAEMALEDDNLAGATRVLGLLRGDKSGVGGGCEKRILDRLEDIATRRCQQIHEELERRLLKEQEAFTQARPHNQAVCREVATLYQDSIEPALAQLESIAGRQSDRLQRVRSNAARAMFALAHAWTWSGRFIIAERTLQTALTLARGTAFESTIIEQLDEYQRRSLAEQQGVTFTGQRQRVVTTRKVLPYRNPRRLAAPIRTVGGTGLGIGALFGILIVIRVLAAVAGVSLRHSPTPVVPVYPGSSSYAPRPLVSPYYYAAPIRSPSGTPVATPATPFNSNPYPLRSPQANPYAPNPSRISQLPNPYAQSPYAPRNLAQPNPYGGSQNPSRVTPQPVPGQPGRR